jgi:uncharacterized protein (TIGR00730 family)
MESYTPPLAYKDQLFLDSDAGRPIRILAEHRLPEVALSEARIDRAFVIFGSARTSPEHPDYIAARELARTLGEESQKRGERYAICTGGGPGIMEAANRGAQEAGVPSVGLNIELPFEQVPNPYIDPRLSFQFHYFFVRKFWFLTLARAIFAFPGGFGTLDELFEALTMLQNSRTRKVPLVLFNRAYWERLVNFDVLVADGMIDKEDLELLRFCDTVQEAADFCWNNIYVN